MVSLNSVYCCYYFSFSFLMPFEETLLFKCISLSVFACIGFKQWKAINPVNFMGFLKWVTLRTLFVSVLFLFSYIDLLVSVVFFFGFKINRKLELSPWPKEEEKIHSRKCHCACFLSRFILFTRSKSINAHKKNLRLYHTQI